MRMRWIIALKQKEETEKKKSFVCLDVHLSESG